MARALPNPDRLSFTPSHPLLNPKFESYKLAPSSLGDAAVSTFPLSTPFTFPTLPGHARLSYHEVAARARHNHLAAGEGGELVWVDGEGTVTAVELDRKTGQPTLHTLLRLPSSSAPLATTAEYPTVLSFSSSLWAVSTGRGVLHLVNIDRSSPTWSSSVQASFELKDSEAEELTPFRLHSVDALSETEAIVLLSKVVKTAATSTSDPEAESATPSTASAKTRLKIPSTTTFEFLSARINLAPQEGSTPFSVDWRLRSNDLPSFVQFDKEAGRYCVGGSAPLAPPSQPKPSTSMDVDAQLEAAEAEADAELLAPDEPSTSSTSSSSAPSVPKPPPFSWLQDKDSLTVAFPIPSDTPTSSIRITFSRQYLTLHIASPSAAAASASLPGGGALPRLSHKKFWAEIDPHTSVWTFDREAEGRDSTFGLLTLHLEKQHAGTKWSDLFAPSSSSSAAEEAGGLGAAKIEEIDPEKEYERVPETLDPSELAAISERMEQWAQGMMAGAEGIVGDDGIGHGVPTSLIGDEMDVEVDAESGKQTVLSWIEGATTGTPKVVVPHRTIPYSLLSTALPLAASPTSTSASESSSITIKHDVDGLLFTPPSPSSPDYTWTHTSTIPALAFVLATKRDTRFVFHLPPSSSSPSTAVLAFDAPALIPGPSPSSSSLARGGGNLFVYVSPPAGEKATTGRQMVVRVGGPNAGALVGAAQVEMESGERIVVVLCEKELGVLRIFA